MILPQIVFSFGDKTQVFHLKDFKKAGERELKLSYVDKIIDNIEGVELVVPRTRNQDCCPYFQSGNYGINGDYPFYRYRKRNATRTFHKSKRY